jgi:hypothetical protein
VTPALTEDGSEADAPRSISTARWFTRNVNFATMDVSPLTEDGSEADARRSISTARWFTRDMNRIQFQ